MSQHIGRYEVLEELGRGGMGAVYKARDPETGREVAIKVLVNGRDATPKQRKRFEREAQALAKVDHPNVVRLRDVGESQGSPYLVMDYHEEGSLGEELELGGELCVTKATRIQRRAILAVIEVAEGLDPDLGGAQTWEEGLQRAVEALRPCASR